MPLVTKDLTVYFYVLEPFPQRTFEPRSYPLDKVAETIRALDPAADDYRIHDQLFGGELFCLFHEDGPEPLLGTYYKDTLNKALTEHKGVVKELELDDGEGLVDASYAAFFPNDVVGIVRTSAKAPGFAKVGRWLSAYGGYPCTLFALPDEDTLAQIEQSASALRRVSLRIRRSRLAAIDDYSSGVASALRSAAGANEWSDMIGVDLAVTAPAHEQLWAAQMQDVIHELLSVLPEFEQAKVKLKGVRREINLRRSHVTGAVTVKLTDTKRVGLRAAAEALFQAYEQEQASIEAAANRWWSSRDARGSQGA